MISNVSVGTSLSVGIVSSSEVGRMFCLDAVFLRSHMSLQEYVHNVSGPPRETRGKAKKPGAWSYVSGLLLVLPRTEAETRTLRSRLVFFHLCIPFHLLQAYYITNPHDQDVQLLSITSSTARSRRYHSGLISFTTYHLLDLQPQTLDNPILPTPTYANDAPPKA